ncbi:hypothetical protein [Shinella sp. M31]|uniref:hypothetical protein n=1 Tax=Shinella sp. M31 TaxID=3368615 RepID=UPI003BA1730C
MTSLASTGNFVAALLIQIFGLGRTRHRPGQFEEGRKSSSENPPSIASFWQTEKYAISHDDPSDSG